jgi:hypothetical protein
MISGMADAVGFDTFTMLLLEDIMGLVQRGVIHAKYFSFLGEGRRKKLIMLEDANSREDAMCEKE